MNRKQRRATSKTGASKASGKPPGEIFAAAAQCHREGRLEDAARLYRQVLAADPGHADSLHRLGVIAHQQGQQAQAVELLHQAISRAPKVAPYHTHLSLVLAALGRLDEAVDSCRTAVSLDPDLPDTHNNLGVLLQRLGRTQEAAACYAKAGELAPQLVEAHNNLGHVLLELGRPEQAQVSYRRVIALAPQLADGHAGLGMALKTYGQFEEASASFQRALAINPAQADVMALYASTQLALGDHRGALAASLRALTLRETPESRSLFVQCVKDIEVESEIAGLRPLLVRALKENWDRPDDLAPVAADLIKQNPAIARLSGADLQDNDLAVLAADELLQALLCRAPNQDLELERLLTAARRRLLGSVRQRPSAQGGLAFACALAQQCFLNEYVFTLDTEEAEHVGQLQEALATALEQGASIDPIVIAAAAAYGPLFAYAPGLLEKSWPEEIEALLIQQIREPQEEEALRAAIPRLTVIKDDVSRLVQKQYEENPYPRWVSAGSAGPPQHLIAHLRRTFPFAGVEEQDGRCDILVAGCGTGRNAIETTQKFQDARTLAVDLSLASLAHAMRKARALGTTAIDYAQADILELGSLERRFNLIEAVGVLHHLADPLAGWSVLVSLLKPKGVMMLGFYSSQARRDLPDNFSGDLGRGADVTAQDVRQARQTLIGQGAAVTERVDFFTTSTCRDLLFHVQEHRLSLGEIAVFLSQNNLKLLGFSLDDVVLAAYRKRFPGDPGAVDLTHWQIFEKDNPDTFSGMYQFWLQKGS